MIFDKHAGDYGSTERAMDRCQASAKDGCRPLSLSRGEWDDGVLNQNRVEIEHRDRGERLETAEVKMEATATADLREKMVVDSLHARSRMVGICEVS